MRHLRRLARNLADLGAEIVVAPLSLGLEKELAPSAHT
jgi:hypothetical protein